MGCDSAGARSAHRGVVAALAPGELAVALQADEQGGPRHRQLLATCHPSRAWRLSARLAGAGRDQPVTSSPASVSLAGSLTDAQEHGYGPWENLCSLRCEKVEKSLARIGGDDHRLRIITATVERGERSSSPGRWHARPMRGPFRCGASARCHLGDAMRGALRAHTTHLGALALTAVLAGGARSSTVVPVNSTRLEARRQG